MSITVTLTEAEAHALCYLTARVSGPDNGPRGSVNKAGIKIAEALGSNVTNDLDYFVDSEEYLSYYGYGASSSVSFDRNSGRIWPI